MSEASLECLCLNIFDVFSEIICLSDLLGFVLMDVLFFFLYSLSNGAKNN